MQVNLKTAQALASPQSPMLLVRVEAIELLFCGNA
jgi:hypothetical protein